MRQPRYPIDRIIYRPLAFYQWKSMCSSSDWSKLYGHWSSVSYWSKCLYFRLSLVRINWRYAISGRNIHGCSLCSTFLMFSPGAKCFQDSHRSPLLVVNIEVFFFYIECVDLNGHDQKIPVLSQSLGIMQVKTYFGSAVINDQILQGLTVYAFKVVYIDCTLGSYSAKWFTWVCITLAKYTGLHMYSHWSRTWALLSH